MFVLLTHEFTASLLVRSSTMDVMGTVLYTQWTNGNYPVVAAIALVMGPGDDHRRHHRRPAGRVRIADEAVSTIPEVGDPAVTDARSSIRGLNR